MSRDAIVLLKQDHKALRRLFRDFRKAGKTDTGGKSRIVDEMIELLTIHSYIENEVMYPRVRALLPAMEDHILEAYEEHHVADLLVMELAKMRSTDERFDAKVAVLIENVSHHLDEEEEEWFPQVREGLKRSTLQQLGDELLAARDDAPQRPQEPNPVKKAIDSIRG